MEADLFLIVFFLGLIGSCLGEYCIQRDNRYPYGSTTRTIHCSFGCCGTYHDQHCCASSTGFIVGIVFAGIFTLAVITAVVCCCIKHKGTRGRVVGPSGVTSTTHNTHSHVFIVPTAGPTPPAYSSVYSSTPGTSMYPPPPAYYQANQEGYMPPAYNQMGAPPPAYTPQGPKYPQTPNPFAAAAGN